MKHTIHVVTIASLFGCSSPEAALDEDAKVPESSEVEIVEEAVFEEPEDAGVEDAEEEPEGISVREMMAQIRANQERTRPTSWYVPSDPDELRTASMLALLRVCVSEEGWADPDPNTEEVGLGCKALWQTARHARGCMLDENTAVSCRDPRLERPAQISPTLVGLYRHSRFATGTVEPRTFRQRWVSTLTLDCEQPSGWPERTRDGSDDYADWISYRPHCGALVEAIGDIVDGTDNLRACPRNSRPIAWGCDPNRRRAIREVLGVSRPANGCNDTWLAQRRQLERLDCGETENAYYCRPGTPHCGTVPESEQILAERENLMN